MATPRTLIQQAFEDLRVLAPGGTVSATVEADAFVYLNQMLSSLSAEGAMAFNQVRQSFNLQAGVIGYTLGSGGTFATTGGKRPFKVTSWAGTSGDVHHGGPALPMDVFSAQSAAAQEAVKQANIKALIDGLAAAAPSILALPPSPVTTNLTSALTGLIAAVPLVTTAPIPVLLGADTSYPLINVRIWPPPSGSPGAIELGYWTAIPQFVTVTDTVSFPDGWEEMLHYGLAILLFPQYGRQGGIDPALAANAQNAKAVIVQQNAMGGLSAAGGQ